MNSLFGPRPDSSWSKTSRGLAVEPAEAAIASGEMYSADPMLDANAEYFDELTYDQVIERKLKVMDTSAIVLCRERGIPLRVFNLNQEGALLGVVRGEAIGTLIH